MLDGMKKLIPFALLLIMSCAPGKSIGTTGGTVSAQGASVEIPAGALGENATIEIQKLSTEPALPSTITAVGDAYQFTGSEDFSKAVEITLPWDPSKVPSNIDASLYGVVILSQESGSTSWVALPGGTLGDNTVSAASPGFSIKIPALVKITCGSTASSGTTMTGADGGSDTGGSTGAGTTPARETAALTYACVCGGIAVTSGDTGETRPSGSMTTAGSGSTSSGSTGGSTSPDYSREVATTEYTCPTFVSGDTTTTDPAPGMTTTGSGGSDGTGGY